MRLRTALLAVLATATALLAPATAGAAPPPSALGGSGPYSAGYETSFRLPDHTIYRPNTLPTGVKLPIVAWGNGACRADGTWFENILTEWASHGFLVIANGRPGGFGQTDSSMLTESIDWAIEENSRIGSKYRNRIDTTKVAVMGQSCGGIETYEVADDPRITTTVLWNSGLLSDSQNHLLQRLHAPIAYFIGGPSDIAYPNAMDDWGRLPAGLPAFMGNLDVGHFGTFDQPNGGEFGRVGGHWLKWQLKGDQASGAQFTGPGCGLCATEWDVRQKNLG
ncbi:alpha/beta hydrolase [Amycolatopsis sp. YIM 10]|uniref:poly(ethylene terephthalate) hydrolase family protein n=1 Tax=Amycolatopsis sp. YIM 10 TaxID=2653857 RepID=UPI0012902EE8|nr:alpha/beta hydrolase [Amycolatopsis sp. YIM 10]QFU91264.1 Alpha/beta hydrolase family protein [Amycolatopsis sp. YIM 10]